MGPAAGQMVRTAGAPRPKTGRRAETRSSPSMQAPRSPATRVGIKRRLLRKGAARAGSLGQDMAGRDAGGAPRVRRPIHRIACRPSGKRTRRNEAEAKNVIRGRIAPPTPAGCLAGLRPPAQGLCQEICAAPKDLPARRNAAVARLLLFGSAETESRNHLAADRRAAAVRARRAVRRADDDHLRQKMLLARMASARRRRVAPMDQPLGSQRRSSSTGGRPALRPPRSGNRIAPTRPFNRQTPRL